MTLSSMQYLEETNERPPEPPRIDELALGRGYRLVGSIAALLGLFGILQAIVGLSMLLASSSASAPSLQGMRGSAARIARVQIAAAERLEEVADKMFTFDLFVNLVHLGVASALLLGGIWVLGRVRKGRALLAAACSWAIIFEVGHLAFYLYKIYGCHLALAELFAKNADFLALQPAMREGFQAGYYFGFFGAVVCSAAFVIAKIGFYGLSANYLGKPLVRLLFGDLTQEEGQHVVRQMYAAG